VVCTLHGNGNYEGWDFAYGNDRVGNVVQNESVAVELVAVHLLQDGFWEVVNTFPLLFQKQIAVSHPERNSAVIDPS
jgi:hypothetical protein